MSNVTISASTLENANFPAGSDVNLSVSVTNLSADVTVIGGGVIPASLIGIAGATIDIESVRYTITGVTSPTTFTITPVYAGSTDTSAAAILRKWIQLRFYVSDAFVPLGASAPVQPGQVGSENFYERVACSITNDGDESTLRIPEITLAATLDGSPGSSTYAAAFFDAAGQRRIADYDGFQQFSLPDTTPTTWGVIFALNNPTPALNLPGSGIFAQTGALAFALRTLQQPAAGLTITNPAGVGGDPTFALADDLAAVEGLSATGLAARTAANTWAARTITGPAAGISVTNGDGVAGNPTIALANDLAALEGLGSTGLAARTADNTWAQRNVAGTTGQVSVANGDGVAGNPTISLPTSVFIGTPGGAPAIGTLTGPDASGANIAGADLRLAGGKATGVAIPGQVSVQYPLIGASGSAPQSLSADSFPVVTSMYRITSGGTISNSAAEVSIFSPTSGLSTAAAGSTRIIEAGISRAGTIYRCRLYGNVATTGTPTLQIKVKLNTTVVADSTAVAMANNTNGRWFLDFDIYVTAIGASGSVTCFPIFQYAGAGTGLVTQIFHVCAAVTTIDFTASQTIDITFQYSAASASNNIVLFGASIERHG